MNPQPKPRPNRDEKRLKHCRSLGCLITRFSKDTPAAWTEHLHVCEWHMFGNGCDPHHIRTGANSGVGTKPGDDRIVPLCRYAHEEYHRIGHWAFEQKYGLDLFDHADRISKEFDRLHPNRPKREPKPRRPIVKSRKAWASVHCGQIGTIYDLKPHSLPRGFELVRVEIKAI